ncbi:MAG: MupG family TIM beta-alpha barrel fold protein [Oscillospiraceae bacterium]|jgi:hypothetical protein|nr:MupG family TIM beta-alpha barrel fold protein [Oscillospiraceae bacterium]
MNDFGISLYLSTGIEKNTEILQKAHASGICHAFTSFHIPEEDAQDAARQIALLLAACKTYQVSLMADVGPETLQKLGIKSFAELKKTAITYLRIDYGFSPAEIYSLSQDFHLVFNASTLCETEIAELERLGTDFSRLFACHNFYPKPLTGLSLERIHSVNERLHAFGMRTMAFVSGDRELRGPLQEGLPTAETHRNGNVLYNMLQLIKDCETDICFIGDIDVSDSVYRQIKELKNGYVRLDVSLLPAYRFLGDTVHHDRPDSSEYVIRSQESRQYKVKGMRFPKEPLRPRKAGSISVSNEAYQRYAGEVEIARKDLPEEERVNIVGQVAEESMQYLPYITDGMGFQLEVKTE